MIKTYTSFIRFEVRVLEPQDIVQTVLDVNVSIFTQGSMAVGKYRAVDGIRCLMPVKNLLCRMSSQILYQMSHLHHLPNQNRVFHLARSWLGERSLAKHPKNLSVYRIRTPRKFYLHGVYVFLNLYMECELIGISRN